MSNDLANCRLQLDDSWKIIKRAVLNAVTAIDVSSPDKLYVTISQSMKFEAATSNNMEYKRNIDGPIERLLEQNVCYILRKISKDVLFVDLGPGDCVKSSVIIDQILKMHQAIYLPVDISPCFLEKALQMAGLRHVDTVPLACRFESIDVNELSAFQSDRLRFLYIGLTFCNFDLSYISKILSRLLRCGDIGLLCIQRPGDMHDVLNPYRSDDTKEFAFGHLRIMGFLQQDFVYDLRFICSRVEVGFITLNDIFINGIIIPTGTRIITAKSFRYAKDFAIEAMEPYLKYVDSFDDPSAGISLIQVTGRKQEPERPPN